MALMAVRHGIALCIACAALAVPQTDREHCLLSRKSTSHLKRSALKLDETCNGYMDGTGCGWTRDWNCPGQVGGIGRASADNSLGYRCCCINGLWNRSQVRQLVASKASNEVTIQESCPTKECMCEKEEGVCMLWGDPHIYVFDGKRHVRILDHGDYWVVKSSCVSVQARYAPGGALGETPSLIQAIAVGGSFLQGHVLAIETGGDVTWDGLPILRDFPSAFHMDDLIDARFSGDSEHIDPSLKSLHVRSVEVTLPLGVRLVVNRWSDHLDVLLAMRPLPGGQDGHCGNFNGDAADDSAELLRDRMGAEVPEQDSLLPGVGGHEPKMELDLEDCPPELLLHAEERCKMVAPANRKQIEGIGAEAMLRSCMMDVCFAGAHFAREDVVIEEQMISRAAEATEEECRCSVPPVPSSAPTPAPTSISTSMFTSTLISTMAPPTLAPTPSPTLVPTPAPTPPALRKTCFVFGDPHIMTFDAVSLAEARARRNLSETELFKGRNAHMVTMVEKQCMWTCGVHWLVRSNDVFIQYISSAAYSTIQGLAFGGPFLQDHTLIVDSKGVVSWDGTQVADSVTGASYQNDLVSLEFFEERIFQKARRPKSIKIELPRRVSLTINVGSVGGGVFRHFLDIFITMPIPNSGTDGYCGDADGDVGDETKRRVWERVPEFRVAAGDNLFDIHEACYTDGRVVDPACVLPGGRWYSLEDNWHASLCDDSTCKIRCNAGGVSLNSDYGPEWGEGKLRECEPVAALSQVLSDWTASEGSNTSLEVAENATHNVTLQSLECSSGLPQDALDKCTSQMPNGTAEDWLEACAIDVCIGGEELLNHTASLAMQSREIVVKEIIASQGSVQQPIDVCHTCIDGESCFNDVRWAMQTGVPSGHYEGKGWAPTIDESSCFEEVQAALKAWQSFPDFVMGGMQERSFPEPCAGTAERHTVSGLVYCR